jgi:hypothetical protein
VRNTSSMSWRIARPPEPCLRPIFWAGFSIVFS